MCLGEQLARTECFFFFYFTSAKIYLQASRGLQSLRPEVQSEKLTLAPVSHWLSVLFLGAEVVGVGSEEKSRRMSTPRQGICSEVRDIQLPLGYITGTGLRGNWN